MVALVCCLFAYMPIWQAQRVKTTLNRKHSAEVKKCKICYVRSTVHKYKTMYNARTLFSCIHCTQYIKVHINIIEMYRNKTCIVHVKQAKKKFTQNVGLSSVVVWSWWFQRETNVVEA